MRNLKRALIATSLIASLVLVPASSASAGLPGPGMEIDLETTALVDSGTLSTRF